MHKHKYGPSLLFALLKDFRDKNAISIEDMAEALGTKKFTLSAYFFGRAVKNLDPAFIRSAARVLGIPPLQAFLIAGVISPDDLLDPYSGDDRLEYVGKVLRNDPLFIGFAPQEGEWAELARSTKVLIALLYEQATSKQVLSDPMSHTAFPPPGG